MYTTVALTVIIMLFLIVIIKSMLDFKENGNQEEANLNKNIKYEPIEEQCKRHVSNQKAERIVKKEIEYRGNQQSKVIDLAEHRKKRRKSIITEKRSKGYNGKNEVRARK